MYTTDTDELLKIIETAKRDKKTFLDLLAKDIRKLPPEIGNLTFLQTLYLDRNQLTKLPEEFINLKNLSELSLNKNRFVTFPKEITLLIYLERLDLHDNELTILPEQISNLTNLKRLSLSNNQLTKIPKEIGDLTNLTELLLSNNELSSLPKEILSCKNLKELWLDGNPLEIPPEIIEKKNKPFEILNYYFQHIEAKKEDKKIVSEVKMLIVGQGGVGKTSLMRRLTKNIFDPHENQTDGINIERWQIGINNNEEIQVNIWDFGGQEIMHATHQFFLTQRSLYLLVLDARQGEQESRVEYWLKIISSFGGNSPIIIVINKIDECSLPLNKTGLKDKYKNIKAFIETSCKDTSGISKLETKIATTMKYIPYIYNEWLLSWFNVKAELENMRKNYISYHEYEKMCREGGIKDELSQRTLISYLHDLGIVLNFSDDVRLKDTNILNPEWVTRGVYQIINSNILFQNKGELNIRELGDILDRKNYPRHTWLFIIDIMRKFELCFDFDGFKDHKFLIPELLYIEELLFNWNYEDSLAFQYHYNVLPGSIISRFIVRAHSLIDQKKKPYWRNGVVLADEFNQALIKSDREEKKFIFG